jgi:transcriptional regulator with XRE-family HTH domain
MVPAECKCVNIQDMPDPTDTAIDIAELAAKLKEQRNEIGLSLRQLAAETGVPYSTLARVEAGKIPDLTTFRNIVAWLGIPPERFFPTPRVRSESTPEFVAHALRNDPALSEQAGEKLAEIFSQMYATLAVSVQPVTLHLRAERAFTPDAGNLLADVLQQMEHALTSEPSR